MDLLVRTSFLSQATSRMQGTISDRVLSQVGLQAKDGLLNLMAADRVLAVYTRYPCEIGREGTVFVPGKLFSNVAKQLPEGMVRLEQEESFLKITSTDESAFMMKIPLLDDARWRDTQMDVEVRTELPSVRLAYMIEQIQFCVEQDSARNYGSVAFLHKPESSVLRMVGSDGLRLSYCSVKLDTPADFLKQGICLSKRTLNELHKMCGEGFEVVSLAISSDQTTIMFQVEGYEVYARLSAVKYPKYQGVIPTANLHMVNLEKSRVQNITKRVLLAADKNNVMRLSFADNKLTFTAKTAGTSESKETISLKDLRAPEVRLTINGKFLNDVLSALATSDLCLQYKTAEDPVVIVPRDEPEMCKSMHILVPIRENA